MANSSNRFCIICTPRTGSQWCVKLIEEAVNSFDLSEFFENWNNSTFYVDNGFVKLKEFIHTKNVPFDINNNYNERIDLLKRADLTQPLTIRFFLFDKYPKEVTKFIIEELQKINFNFIVLDRNFQEQILSYLIARLSTNKFNKNFFNPNEVIVDPIYVKLDERLKKTLDNIYVSKKNWNANINELFKNIPYHVVRYESMIEDMEKILNTQLKYNGEKSIKGDPLDLIINRHEILTFIKTNYNKAL